MYLSVASLLIFAFFLSIVWAIEPSDLERVSVLTSGILPPLNTTQDAQDLNGDSDVLGPVDQAESHPKLRTIRLYAPPASTHILAEVAAELVDQHPTARIEVRSGHEQAISPAAAQRALLRKLFGHSKADQTSLELYSPLLVESQPVTTRDELPQSLIPTADDNYDLTKAPVQPKSSKVTTNGTSILTALRSFPPWLRLYPGGQPEPKAPPQHNVGTEELPDPALYRYGLLIDSGSTGNRIFIYRWHPRVRTLHALPETETPAPVPPFSRPFTQHQWSMKTMPGLSSYAKSPDQAGPQSLAPLISFAYDVFVSLNATEKIGESPIFLKATGGLRALPDAPRSAVMDHVRNYLAQTGFRFEPEWAQIISGEEEGIFGWLTVNYLVSGRTVFADQVRGDTAHRVHTVGALDLGGASMQSTFRPLPNQTILANKFSLDIAGTHNDVYTECFWYYGKDTALWRVHSVLFAAAFPNLVSLHKALPHGWRMQLPDSSVDASHSSHGLVRSANRIGPPTQPRDNGDVSEPSPTNQVSSKRRHVKADIKPIRLPKALAHHKSRISKTRALHHHVQKEKKKSKHIALLDAEAVSHKTEKGTLSDELYTEAIADVRKNAQTDLETAEKRVEHAVALALQTSNGTLTPDDLKHISDHIMGPVLSSHPRLSKSMRHKLDEAARSHVARSTAANDAIVHNETVSEVTNDDAKDVSEHFEDEGLVFRSPCLPTGFEAVYEGADGLSAVVVGDADWDTCYELAGHIVKTRLTGPCVTDDRSEALKRGRHGMPADLDSDSDHSGSATDSDDSSDDTFSPFPGECTSFFGFYRPDFSNRKFYAFSGFAYFPTFFNLPSNATLSDIETKGREVCNTSWTDLMMAHPQADRYYLRSYCWLAVYSVALLHKGFGFPRVAPPPTSTMSDYPLVWASQLNGTDVTYALGAMLYESNRLPWKLGPDIRAKELAEDLALYKRMFAATLIALIAALVYIFVKGSPQRFVEDVPMTPTRSNSSRAISHADAMEDDEHRKLDERQGLLANRGYGAVDKFGANE